MRITPGAEKALLQGHPWVYDRAISSQSHTGDSGDLAVIFNRKRQFLAIGLYDPLSPIRVRVLQARKPAAINQNWFKHRLENALKLRERLITQPVERITTGFRVVHGENDGLPGLIIDQYERTIVLKLYTTAWIPHLVDVLPPLTELLPATRLVLRLSRTLFGNSQNLHGLKDGQILYGPPIDGPELFWENGLRFEADLIYGQKTGFFFDQRENRTRVEKLVQRKSVLNVFAYTGGFSVYAARGGALKVISIDTSLPALEAAVRNFSHNKYIPSVTACRHETIARDAFEALARMGENGQRFDVVIIDPPAFAQKQSQTTQAMSAYEKLTTLGLRLLNPGGILVQASCSSRVGAEDFFESIHRSAARAGRSIKEIERTGHALDHPIAFKEGAYLKCLFGTVQ
jgi:23S rRNA (cytosine1962-C5)-methyltransferase